MEPIAILRSVLGYWPWAVIIVLIFASVFTVEQQRVAVVTRFGKFVRTADAGLNIHLPFIEDVRGWMSLKVLQLDIKITTKTRDNVLVTMVIAVQYAAMPDKILEAYYKLQNPAEQIEAYVADAMRAKTPTLELDALYENKDEVADAVEGTLRVAMSEYGFSIKKVLIVDIQPDAKVAAAMNDINAARREQVAAQARADADMILKVTAAKAGAEAMALEGKGIADQRKAILEGLAVAVKELQEQIPGIKVQEIMAIVMLTRYFDTLQEVAASSDTNTIMLPHSPDAFGALTQQVIAAIKAGNAAN